MLISKPTLLAVRRYGRRTGTNEVTETGRCGQRTKQTEISCLQRTGLLWTSSLCIRKYYGSYLQASATKAHDSFSHPSPSRCQRRIQLDSKKPMPFKPIDPEIQKLCAGYESKEPGFAKNIYFDWIEKNKFRIRQANAVLLAEMSDHMKRRSAHINVGMLKVR